MQNKENRQNTVQENERAGKRKTPALYYLLILLLAGVFLFSGYKLFSILRDYRAARSAYREMGNEYTAPYTETASEQNSTLAPSENAESAKDGSTEDTDKEASGGVSGQNGQGVSDGGVKSKTAHPPISVDFEKLCARNPDIIGWICVDAFVDIISYPIARAKDNDYYLHRDIDGGYLFAGTIFADYRNGKTFGDPNTILYGHNMKDRSMFGNLRFLKEKERLDKDPYFWILTPQGNYCYRIFAVFDTPVDGDVYTFFDGPDGVAEWEKSLADRSAVRTDESFSDDDLVVTLSTCTSNDDYRCVVVGKCVSEITPAK